MIVILVPSVADPVLTSHGAVGEGTTSAMDLTVNCKRKFSELQKIHRRVAYRPAI